MKKILAGAQAEEVRAPRLLPLRDVAAPTDRHVHRTAEGGWGGLIRIRADSGVDLFVYWSLPARSGCPSIYRLKDSRKKTRGREKKCGPPQEVGVDKRGVWIKRWTWHQARCWAGFWTPLPPFTHWLGTHLKGRGLAAEGRGTNFRRTHSLTAAGATPLRPGKERALMAWVQRSEQTQEQCRGKSRGPGYH